MSMDMQDTIRYPNVTLVGCWAHARRKFDEALNALPESKRHSAVTARKDSISVISYLPSSES